MFIFNCSLNQVQRSRKDFVEKMNESCPLFIHSFKPLIQKKLGLLYRDLTFIFTSKIGLDFAFHVLVDSFFDGLLRRFS